MSYNNINRSGYWKDAANSLNYNFNKIFSEITELKEKLIKSKGLFKTIDDLKNRYPNPVQGDWAIVGDTIPGEIFIVDENNQWVSSGELGGGDSIDLSEYIKSELVDNVISILDQEEDTLVITASVSPEINEYTGEDKTVNISWSIRKGDNVVQDLYYVKIKKDDELIETSQLPIGAVQTKVNKLGSTKFNIEASTLISIENKDIIYNQVMPIYIGTSTETATSKIIPTELEKQEIKLSPEGTYTLKKSTSPDQYLWICIPKDFKEISEVRIEDEQKISLEKAVIGGLGLYKIYRSTEVLGITKDTGLNVVII